ncbi:accessory Sec system translocase SecA2 [Microbacterium sp. NPDC091662]|uniref:accessory Sec system translocase SecA2 n=1 Tax=Microbacterium sp. NPDC091662 TaxID=3364211 RepID=UPI0037FAAC22
MPGSTSFVLLEPVVDHVLSNHERRRGLSTATLVEIARGKASTPADLLSAGVQASERSLGVMPFRHQILAAAAMLEGCAVEMDTGEGKTLAGALAAAAYALQGRSVHVISVNDYLARRDAEWMGPLYRSLGLTVAAVSEASTTDERRAAYRSDVIYASVSEIGYDILRDRFCIVDEDRVAPAMDVAIVDEADAVMIDEAIVPLVLAGNAQSEVAEPSKAALLVRSLTEGSDYVVDQDGSTVTFTDGALDALEAELGGVNLYAPEHIPTLTGLNLALHAQVLMQRDVDYVIENDVLRLVNTTRGRITEGQRWPDGMHSAVEAKEGLETSGPGVVLDMITIQDLVTQYQTLAGMSGTVVPVAEELLEFYALRSGRVERRLPQARVDEPDVIMNSEAGVLDAVSEAVQQHHSRGQPVLVGTQSIAESETLAKLLTERGHDVRVLNAKNDAAEALTIARAGELDAITISTQMSGRGTDIVLGGVDGGGRGDITRRGGLVVIQVGLYPSRRLDAQLRGRAGRQGDPGTSVRIASLRDELITTTATRSIRAQIEYPERLTRRAKERILDTAQDIAEAVRADQHRATWGYNRAIAMQRSAVLRERFAVTHSDDFLWTRLPDLPLDRSDAAKSRALRELAAFSLDDLWCEHLASLQATRDGIHLRALGGQDPLDEFHRIALVEFEEFFERAYDETRQALYSTGEFDLEAAVATIRARRPSATWTYMITDNPLGDAASRAAESLRSMWMDRPRKGRSRA